MIRYSAALLILLQSLDSATGQDFKPNLGPDQPSVTVRCGEITVLLRQKSQWTPGRFDFRDAPMTTEKSAYGTVFMFPKIGFIGTAHLENEPEDLEELSFVLDEQVVDEPAPELSGEKFLFLRKSRIRSLGLVNKLEIQNGRIYESVDVSATKDTSLKLVYHFMHAWSPTCNALVSGNDDADPQSVVSLLDSDDVNRKFYINQPRDWIAIYEPVSQYFAVSRLLEYPAEAGQSSKIWNVPNTYRKYYLTSFANRTVPAGFHGRWRMVTAFGGAHPDEWIGAARQLAEKLRVEPPQMPSDNDTTPGSAD